MKIVIYLFPKLGTYLGFSLPLHEFHSHYCRGQRLIRAVVFTHDGSKREREAVKKLTRRVVRNEQDIGRGWKRWEKGVGVVLFNKMREKLDQITIPSSLMESSGGM